MLDVVSIRIDDDRVEPRLISWRFPEPSEMLEGMGEITIAYDAALPHGPGMRTLTLTAGNSGFPSVYLVNVVMPQDQTIHILAQKRDETQSFYELDYRQDSVPLSPGSPEGGRRWSDGSAFPALFRLGMQHIAEGTDHILFLLALLLPAPVLAAGARWGGPAPVRQSVANIVGIVTAFTLGHSLTLGLAAMSFVRVPERPIEVLIALSILVSAIHALRPLFPGREPAIAGFFGLIHGLAFATTLDRLGLGWWDRLAGILAFNLGIETMQMLIVGLTLPSLLLMSRTRLYPGVRIVGGLFAGCAASGWIVERLLDVQIPVDTIVNGVARQAPWIAVSLFVTSLLCRALFRSEDSSLDCASRAYDDALNTKQPGCGDVRLSRDTTARRLAKLVRLNTVRIPPSRSG